LGKPLQAPLEYNDDDSLERTNAGSFVLIGFQIQLQDLLCACLMHTGCWLGLGSVDNCTDSIFLELIKVMK
jgi:hypothetical protein